MRYNDEICVKVKRYKNKSGKQLKPNRRKGIKIRSGNKQEKYFVNVRAKKKTGECRKKYVQRDVYCDKHTRHENLHVLDGLRSEMIQTENKKTTYTVYMYTVFFFVFAMGISSHIRYLIALLVLLIFQAQINHCTWLMRKVSLYIYYFFEVNNRNQDMHWETMQYDKNYLSADGNTKKKFAMWLSNRASKILAVITTSVELGSCLNMISKNGGLFLEGINMNDMMYVGEMFLAVLLLIAVLLITKIPESLGEDELSYTIERYYLKCYK